MSVKSRELIEALQSADKSMTEEVLDAVRERIGRTRTFSLGTAGDIMADCAISKATMNKVLDLLEFPAPPAAALSALGAEVGALCTFVGRMGCRCTQAEFARVLKDWCCRAQVASVRSPWLAHVACVPRLWQRQSFSCTLVSQ